MPPSSDCGINRSKGIDTAQNGRAKREILRRHDLLDLKRSQQHLAPEQFEYSHPNDLWQMDFKGHFPLVSGGRCHPLTALDDHSRYALILAGLWR